MLKHKRSKIEEEKKEEGKKEEEKEEKKETAEAGDKNKKRVQRKSKLQAKRDAAKAKHKILSLAAENEKLVRVVPQGTFPSVLSVAVSEEQKVEIVQKKTTRYEKIKTNVMLAEIQKVRPTTHIFTLLHYYSTPKTEVETMPKYPTTLYDEIKATHGEGLGFTKSVSRLFGLLDGIASFHAAGYVHMDMKSNNVGVTGSGEIKIIDLGSSRKFRNLEEGESNSTRGYRSSREHINWAQPDLFAIGCIWIHMLTGELFKASDSISDDDAWKAAYPKIALKFRAEEVKLAIDMARTLLGFDSPCTALDILKRPLFAKHQGRKQPVSSADPASNK